MKVAVIPIVICALGRVTKEFVPEIGGLGNKRMSGDHSEVSWRLEETCCHSDSSGKPSANTDVENSQKNTIII